jgi:hypothetical protein
MFDPCVRKIRQLTLNALANQEGSAKKPRIAWQSSLAISSDLTVQTFIIDYFVSAACLAYLDRRNHVDDAETD